MSLFSGPLRRRELRLLVAGSAVSLVGDGIYTVAMAVAVLHIGGSAGSLAALAVANLVPRVAFGLLGGVLADRFSRRGLVAGATWCGWWWWPRWGCCSCSAARRCGLLLSWWHRWVRPRALRRRRSAPWSRTWCPRTSWSPRTGCSAA